MKYLRFDLAACNACVIKTRMRVNEDVFFWGHLS